MLEIHDESTDLQRTSLAHPEGSGPQTRTKRNGKPCVWTSVGLTHRDVERVMAGEPLEVASRLPQSLMAKVQADLSEPPLSQKDARTGLLAYP